MNIPEGTRDIIYDDALVYEDISQRLSSVYAKNGFRPVMTPAVEYYDVFGFEGQPISQESMYKFTDMSGRLIVLRADNTTPLARVAATKLRSAQLPQKICYNQNIYRINSEHSGRRNEILQSGVEIIGAAGIKSDIICLAVALEALRSLGVDFKIEIGTVGFYNALIKELDLSEKETDIVREYVDTKNTVSLDLMKRRNGFEKIKRLPMLYGGEEVFDEAYSIAGDNAEAIEALDYIKKLYGALASSGYADNIMIDLGLVHKIDYYTGVVFRGYIEGAGEAVLSGGRYDNLINHFGYNAVATGFAINVGLCADTIIKNMKEEVRVGADYLIFFEADGFKYADEYKTELDKKGFTSEFSSACSIEDALAYAREARIQKLAIIGSDGSIDIKEAAE